jgi:uncharacterized protein (TIGR02996 family)
MSDATGQALLQDIVENPEDDIPRLVYADWLEERGEDARSELIRAQVRRNRLPEGDRAAASLLRREKALLKEHPDWCDTGLGLAGEMRRGFLEHVACTPQQLVEQGDALFERFPIRSLVLRADPSDRAQIRAIAKRPWLSRLTALRVQRPTGVPNGIGDETAEALIGARHLTRLTVLELFACGLTERSARAIAKASHLKLTALQLAWNQLLATGAGALAGAAHLSGLTRLELASTTLSPGGAAALAASPHLRNLRVLDLNRSGIQVAGLRELTASAILANVEELNLGRLRFAVRAAQVLARCGRLTNLRELNLNSNRLEDEGASALADSTHLPRLRRLGLRANRLTLAGVRALAESTAWPELKHLDLGRNNLTAREKERARGLFNKGVAKL